jgi:hypothetical protein
MGIHTDIVPAGMRQDEHETGRLSTDAWQRQQLLHAAGHDATVAAENLAAGLAEVPSLDAIEADRVDEALDNTRRQADHGARRAGDAE